MESSNLFKVGGVTVKLMSTLARFLAGLSKNTIRESFLVFTFTFSDVGGLKTWYVTGYVSIFAPMTKSLFTSVFVQS